MDEPTPATEIMETLEGDHMRLHKLARRIQQAIEVNDVDSAARCLLELQVAQTSHFRFEERLMEDAGFPDREAHARSHERQTATLGAINQVLALGRFSRLSRDLGAFVEDSLAHVAELDETFRCFLADLPSPPAR